VEKSKFIIEYSFDVEKKLKKFPKNISKRILEVIKERLSNFPLEVGKPLLKEWKEHRRLRVGDYRVIYKVFEDKVVVLIIEIDHRKQVYER
jgi:mRNA interferase RelE/StbE